MDRERPTTRAIDEMRDGFRYVVGFPPIWSALLLLARRRDHGDAVHDSHAGHRRDDAARRPAHARLSDDRVGRGRAGRRVLPRVALVGARTRARDGRRDDDVRRRRSCCFSFSRCALAVAAHSADRRRGHDGRAGVDEHHAPDDRRGAAARPRDGVLRDGVSGDGADREPDRRRASPTGSARRARLSIGGVACILGGIWFATKLAALPALVRPIYIERGIIQE